VSVGGELAGEADQCHAGEGVEAAADTAAGDPPPHGVDAGDDQCEPAEAGMFPILLTPV